MKTLLFLAGFAAIIFSSCDHSANIDSSSSTAAANTLTAGSWRVTLFTDSGNDETSDFNGYSFTFSSNGNIQAVKNSVTTTGSWSTTSSKFIIDLGPKTDANKPLGELTDDWKVISNTDVEIKLTDDNPSSNEFLTFSKN